MFTRKSVSTLALVSVAVLALAAPVSAAGSGKTTIQLVADFSIPSETFTTTGGVLCPSGESQTDSIMFAGRGRAVTFHGVKTLICADGSGTFRITFDAATTAGSPQDQGGWRVIDGTGAYASLSGGGNLVGTYTPVGVDDLYEGYVRL